MADNVQIKDANGDNVTMATREVGGVHHTRSAGVFLSEDKNTVHDVTPADRFPVALGEGSPFFFSEVGNSAEEVKASGGLLFALEVQNKNDADCWIQIFDEAGTITVGTTTPVLSFLVPKGNGVDYGAMDWVFPVPIKFANSIAIACTTTPTGAGDPSDPLIVNGVYS